MVCLRYRNILGVISDAATLADVGPHSTPADCWQLISAKAYDLTAYRTKHPPGTDSIDPYCGKDGTTIFNANHGASSKAILATYQVSTAQTGSTGGGSQAGTTGSSQAGTTGSSGGAQSGTTGSSGGATATSGAPSAAEIAKHSTAADCWLLILGNAYDLTAYANTHPFGPKVITDSCGKDGTTMFDQSYHDQSSRTILAKYIKTTSGGATKVTTTTTASTGIDAWMEPPLLYYLGGFIVFVIGLVVICFMFCKPATPYQPVGSK